MLEYYICMYTCMRAGISLCFVCVCVHVYVHVYVCLCVCVVHKHTLRSLHSK